MPWNYENTLAAKLHNYLNGEWGTDCYSINGGFDADGYTRVRVNQKSLKAHKLALEFKLGRELEKLEVTRHLCHNRACCNPNHLDVGSALDNSLDCIKANRTLKGTKHPKSKYSVEQVLEVKRMLAEGISIKFIEARLGIPDHAIRDIKRGKTWSHVS